MAKYCGEPLACRNRGGQEMSEGKSSLWSATHPEEAQMVARLVSVNVGLPREIVWRGQTVRTCPDAGVLLDAQQFLDQRVLVFAVSEGFVGTDLGIVPNTSTISMR